jgi:hypothetical protein
MGIKSRIFRIHFDGHSVDRQPMSAISGPTQGDYGRTSSWKPRPITALVLTVLLRGGPILLSATAGIVTSRTLPKPHGVWWAVWLAALILVSQVTLRIAERCLRRLMPIPALLRFSLVFPDKAPKRFATALRSGNVEKMRREMDETAERGLPEDLSEAAGSALRMVAQLNRHDRGTRGHSERVRAFSEMLADEMGLDGEFRDKLRWGALLHDMGKLTVPAAILNKAGKPTDDEWKILQGHPAAGERILAPLQGWLGDAFYAAGQHHERWDGKGYPKKLAGEEISLSARIVAVADAYAVMTAARAYKKPLPLAVAREELANGSGTQFDPQVVRAMLSVSIGRTSRFAGPISTLANVPFIASLLSTTAPTIVPAVVSSGAAVVALTASLVVPSPVSNWNWDDPVNETQPAATSSVPTDLAFTDPLAVDAASSTRIVGAVSSRSSIPSTTLSVVVTGSVSPITFGTPSSTTREQFGSTVTSTSIADGSGGATPPSVTVVDVEVTRPAHVPPVPGPTVELPTVVSPLITPAPTRISTTLVTTTRGSTTALTTLTATTAPTTLIDNTLPVSGSSTPASIVTSPPTVLTSLRPAPPQPLPPITADTMPPSVPAQPPVVHFTTPPMTIESPVVG